MASSPRAPAPSARKAFWVGILVGLMIAAFAVVAWSAWRKPARPAADPAAATAFLATNRTAEGVVETPSGLQYRILRPGTAPRPGPRDVLRPGTAPRPGPRDVAMAGYVGTLTDGTVFDRSDTPVALPVAEVVPGFSEALQLMPVGAKYRVWIKPELGYGSDGAGPIPGNAVLIFDIDLTAVRPAR